MKHIQRLIMAGILMLTLVILVTTGARAQWDDNPNLDQIPRYLTDNPPPPSPPLSSVMTIGNWDNFNLGVDFAECNIMGNPQQPAWYFTAYNTNATHHTENGHDWFINNPSFGANMWGDPVVAYDSLGNLYYENMYGASTVQGCKVITSTTNGQSWGTPATAISGIDKNWIAADQTSGPYANYVYTCMTANSGGNFARSTDYGATWTTTKNFSQQALPGMMVCVGPNGNIQGGSVYVVTNGGSTFSPVYGFHRSTDGGGTFTQMSSQNFAGYVGSNVSNRHSVQNMRTRPYPFITADNSYGPNRGRLYLIYASNDPPGNGNKPDIWNRYSDDGGATWSTAKKVNDDPNTTQNNQWHPATWCDKETGRLYVMWMDTRDTPTSDSAFIYATYSDDGGATFVPNQKISNKKMKINCTTCGGGGTPRYQGDYNGIYSNKKVANMSWTDFRNGNFLSVSAYFPDFALVLDHSADTLYSPLDSVVYQVNIPEVKLYTDTVMVSAEVSPVPTAGSITFVYPSGTEITTYPNSLPVRVVLNGEVPVGNYTLTFFAKGPNGTPVHKRTSTLKVIQGNIYMVNATADPGAVCQGVSSQLNAQVTGGTGPYTYSWMPETGLNNANIANPVATPMETTTYVVTVTDNTSQITIDSVTVTVLTAPPVPGDINGLAATCENGSAGYSIAEMPNVTTYSWTVPGDATITEGQGTNAITVLWGVTPGTVSVIATNSCGNSLPSALEVTLIAIPANPGEILGSSLGCKNELVQLNIDEVPGATTYEWTVPADASISSGQGTNAINVVWGATSGDVTVIAQNACGNSGPSVKTLPVDSIPLDAGLITGKDTVCTNHTGYTYSIDAIANAQTYIWSVPGGATIANGQGTNQITVDFAQEAVSGTISVYGSNDCGLGLPSSLEVIVQECAGMAENSLNAEVMIFPNPTDGKLNIRIAGSERSLFLQISDMKGQTIRTEQMNDLPREFTRQVDVAQLPEGVYMLRLSHEARSFGARFVVKH